VVVLITVVGLAFWLLAVMVVLAIVKVDFWTIVWATVIVEVFAGAAGLRVIVVLATVEVVAPLAVTVVFAMVTF
jgi:hypothetical protein